MKPFLKKIKLKKYDKVPHILCKSCGAPVELDPAFETSSEPFLLQCPKCMTTQHYTKMEIQIPNQ